MVEIVAHRDAWASEFRAIATILRRGLAETAVRIDHIGSTAVPALAAKDVIDIQIAVAALDEGVREKLERLGYSRVEAIQGDHRPPNHEGTELEWRKWFFRPPSGQRPTNTHVRVVGRANQRYPLLFRDYLREHPATAAAYAELKRRLAQHLAEARMYPEVKDPAVDLIYFAAEQWAATSGWSAGPSDA